MQEDRGIDVKRKNKNAEGEGGHDFNDLTRRVRDIPHTKRKTWEAPKQD
jgi:hypothetical protein